VKGKQQQREEKTLLKQSITYSVLWLTKKYHLCQPVEIQYVYVHLTRRVCGTLSSSQYPLCQWWSIVCLFCLLFFFTSLLKERGSLFFFFLAASHCQLLVSFPLSLDGTNLAIHLRRRLLRLWVLMLQFSFLLGDVVFLLILQTLIVGISQRLPSLSIGLDSVQQRS
jgi:hypothetical protein